MSKPDSPNINKETKSTTIESGYFTRVIEREGNKKKQRTIKREPNKARVTLYNLERLTLYAYPYDYPDNVFLAVGDNNIMLDRYDVRKLLALSNKATWYLLRDGLKRSIRGLSKTKLAKRVAEAYNEGFKRK